MKCDDERRKKSWEVLSPQSQPWSAYLFNRVKVGHNVVVNGSCTRMRKSEMLTCFQRIKICYNRNPRVVVSVTCREAGIKMDSPLRLSQSVVANGLELCPVCWETGSDWEFCGSVIELR